MEQIIIDRPANFASSVKAEICALVANGGQVNYNLVKVGVHRANIIATLVLDGQVISCACSKNPQIIYRVGVFEAAKIPEYADHYLNELGYIATREGYEGRKYCQRLLIELFNHISNQQMFATTRKPGMVHILNKLGFKKHGETYKGGLELMLYGG